MKILSLKILNIKDIQLVPDGAQNGISLPLVPKYIVINFALYLEIQVLKLYSQYFQTYLINSLLTSAKIISEMWASFL